MTPGTLFGLPSRAPGEGVGELGAARVAGNAARAIDARVTRLEPARPPALYAFDPDTGRLAVTTPAYSTAIMPVSQGAFRYGGIELARFHDAGHEPVATIGGRPPASFGLRVRDARHRRVLVTQEPRLHLGGRPLRLTRAPHGVGVSPYTGARTAYAGPFADLRAVGVARAAGLKATVRHRFTRSFAQATWTVRRRSGRSRLSVDVLFPSRGGGARLHVERRGGDRRPVGPGPYAGRPGELPRDRERACGLRRRPARQGGADRAGAADAAAAVRARIRGPTLAVELARDDRLARAQLTARHRARAAAHACRRRGGGDRLGAGRAMMGG